MSNFWIYKNDLPLSTKWYCIACKNARIVYPCCKEVWNHICINMVIWYIWFFYSDKEDNDNLWLQCLKHDLNHKFLNVNRFACATCFLLSNLQNFWKIEQIWKKCNIFKAFRCLDKENTLCLWRICSVSLQIWFLQTESLPAQTLID